MVEYAFGNLNVCAWHLRFTRGPKFKTHRDLPFFLVQTTKGVQLAFGVDTPTDGSANGPRILTLLSAVPFSAAWS